jgi:hypothetical protein
MATAPPEIGVLASLRRDLSPWVLLLSVLNVVGQSVQNISVIYWINSFNVPMQVTVFPIIFSAGTAFAVVFGIAAVLYATFAPVKHRRRALWISWRFFFETIIVGFFNMLNGFLSIFASPPNRVPPIPQSFLGNFGGFFAFYPQKVFLGEHHKRFFTLLPLTSFALILAGTLLSISPQFQDASTGFGGLSGIPWILTFLVGVFFGSIYNVRQQYALKYLAALPQLSLPTVRATESAALLRRNSPDDTTTADSLNVLFYGCTWVVVFFVACFWANILPWFGGSPGDLEGFYNSTKYCLDCILTIENEACPHTWLPALLFTAGYLISYWVSALLNKISATYSMLSLVPVSPVCVVVWLIFPRFNPGQSLPPWWSIWPSLVMLLVGVLIWQVYEVRQANAAEAAAIAAAAQVEEAKVQAKLAAINA